MSKNSFDFKFFFIIDDIWGWSRVCRTVSVILMVWSQKRSMEDWVYAPLRREFKTINPRAEYVKDFEWSFSLGFELPKGYAKIQILCLEED